MVDYYVTLGELEEDDTRSSIGDNCENELLSLSKLMGRVLFLAEAKIFDRRYLHQGHWMLVL